ncbi:hypothetical protein B0A53_03270 [Rhodotorula sp. CCFEE 5036]|nr:hypothetical protein B0A53_03270 [Rhodotorula sp. CCFEE 5036]
MILFLLLQRLEPFTSLYSTKIDCFVFQLAISSDSNDSFVAIGRYFGAISVALTELEWYSSIISTLPIGNSAPLRILNDNKAGVDALHSPTYMEEKKQHDVKLKFVREQIEREFVELKWIPGTENIADLLTKALPARRVLELGKRYGLIGWPTDGTWGAC